MKRPDSPNPIIDMIHHVALSVDDLERSLTFYCDGLGCTCVVRRHLEADGYFMRAMGTDCPSPNGAEIAILRLGSSTLELIQWADTPAIAGGAHLCLLVPDLEACCAALRQHGITPLAEAQDIAHGPNIGGRIAWIRDPDGHRIELMELTAQRRQERGLATP